VPVPGIYCPLLLLFTLRVGWLTFGDWSPIWVIPRWLRSVEHRLVVGYGVVCCWTLLVLLLLLLRFVTFHLLVVNVIGAGLVVCCLLLLPFDLLLVGSDLLIAVGCWFSRYCCCCWTGCDWLLLRLICLLLHTLLFCYLVIVGYLFTLLRLFCLLLIVPIDLICSLLVTGIVVDLVPLRSHSDPVDSVDCIVFLCLVTFLLRYVRFCCTFVLLCYGWLWFCLPVVPMQFWVGCSVPSCLIVLLLVTTLPFVGWLVAWITVYVTVGDCCCLLIVYVVGSLITVDYLLIARLGLRCPVVDSRLFTVCCWFWLLLQLVGCWFWCCLRLRCRLCVWPLLILLPVPCYVGTLIAVVIADLRWFTVTVRYDVYGWTCWRCPITERCWLLLFDSRPTRVTVIPLRYCYWIAVTVYSVPVVDWLPTIVWFGCCR